MRQGREREHLSIVARKENAVHDAPFAVRKKESLTTAITAATVLRLTAMKISHTSFDSHLQAPRPSFSLVALGSLLVARSSRALRGERKEFQPPRTLRRAKEEKDQHRPSLSPQARAAFQAALRHEKYPSSPFAVLRALRGESIFSRMDRCFTTAITATTAPRLAAMKICHTDRVFLAGREA